MPFSEIDHMFYYPLSARFRDEKKLVINHNSQDCCYYMRDSSAYQSPWGQLMFRIIATKHRQVIFCYNGILVIWIQTCVVATPFYIKDPPSQFSFELQKNSCSLKLISRNIKLLSESSIDRRNLFSALNFTSNFPP